MRYVIDVLFSVSGGRDMLQNELCLPPLTVRDEGGVLTLTAVVTSENVVAFVTAGAGAEDTNT